jgi:hypothetical protein
MRYGQLFDYLDRRLARKECDNTLRFTQQFARRHRLFFGELSQTVEDMGGYCDCEVLLNAARTIAPEEVIGEETFTTPRKYAIAEGLYCHCRVKGEPASWKDAFAAQEMGVHVE